MKRKNEEVDLTNKKIILELDSFNIFDDIDSDVETEFDQDIIDDLEEIEFNNDKLLDDLIYLLL